VARKSSTGNDALDVDRPEQFLRRERIAQRAGILLLSIFVLAGIAGLFGNGPLSEVSLTSGSTTIQYERFARHTFRTRLEISVADANGSTLAIRIPRAFLDRVDMLEVRPANTLTHLDGDAAIFEVPVVDGVTTLQLHYEPNDYGVLEMDIAAGSQPAAHVRQIVFF
jgi:hypothetical protein